MENIKPVVVLESSLFLEFPPASEALLSVVKTFPGEGANIGALKVWLTGEFGSDFMPEFSADGCEQRKLWENVKSVAGLRYDEMPFDSFVARYCQFGKIVHETWFAIVSQLRQSHRVNLFSAGLADFRFGQALAIEFESHKLNPPVFTGKLNGSGPAVAVLNSKAAGGSTERFLNGPLVKKVVWRGEPFGDMVVKMRRAGIIIEETRKEINRYIGI